MNLGKDFSPFVTTRAVRQVNEFMSLSESQKETFMALVEDWYGTLEELLIAVKLLAD